MQRFKFLIAISTCSFGLVLLVGIVYAGSLTPSASPAATSYTLTDIYTRLTTNATSTAGDHDFAPSVSPASTLYTMTQVYNAIPTIDTTKVFTGSTYLGVTGTLTGACATSTFDGTGNKISDAADGSGNGTNRWCMTDSGDAVAGSILSGQVAWVDGQAITGSILTRTLSASTGAVAAGYYNATTLPTVESDLVSGNIKSGVNIFGVAGDSNVVNTTSGDAVAGEIISGRVAWVDGQAITGSILTLTLSASTGTVAAGYYNATTLPTVESDLASGNIKVNVQVFGVTGSYVGYPGTGWTPNGSGDGSTPLNETNCTGNWYWFEDGNGDGDATDPEDGICVQVPSPYVTAKNWNGNEDSAARDNTYIASYECEGNFPAGTITAGTYRGVDDIDPETFDTTWNDGDCALCQADCYDGKKDLPDNPYDTGSHYMPGEGSASPNHEGPLTPEVLKNWKGTRLPTSNDFFGFCGYKSTAGTGGYETSCSSDTTHGAYGQMIGRTGECIDLSDTSWEWLSEQRGNISARVAGGYACSYFISVGVNDGGRFRAVFRP